MRIASHKYWLKKTWNHFCKRKLKAKPRRLRHCWKMNANDVVVVKCLRRIFRIVVGARRTYPPFTRSAFLAVQICTLRSDRPLKRSAKSAHLLSYHVRTLSVAARAYFPSTSLPKLPFMFYHIYWITLQSLTHVLKSYFQLFEFGDKYRGKYDSSITVAQKYYRSYSGYAVRDHSSFELVIPCGTVHGLIWCTTLTELTVWHVGNWCL